VILTWDERKRLANLAKHGLDFAELTLDFFLGATVFSSTKDRSLAVGIFKELAMSAVVFAPVGTEALAVISMRPASRKERRHVSQTQEI
jgi:uncharacterized protein